MNDIIRLRHTLHTYPELSGREIETTRIIRDFFSHLNPDRTLTDLGGHGLAFIFQGEKPGPTLLLRCDLDAVPVRELLKKSYRSVHEGIAHQCGHDGHMAIMAAVGQELSQNRPARGRAVLLYQPAEESGSGAAAVIADPRFSEIRPDYSFALHNLPGFPLGSVLIREGVFNSASRGIAITLKGTAAHAAQPETGLSPAPAMCRIVKQLTDLQPGLVPPDETAFITVVGSTLGEKAYGTAPARAEIWATLRSGTDTTMNKLAGYAEKVSRGEADTTGLDVSIGYEDIFTATVNSPEAVGIIRKAAAGKQIIELDRPFRWSEDFGRFTSISTGALFGIGAGLNSPELHSSGYDFPDELIETGKTVFMNITAVCLSVQRTEKN